MQAPGLIKPISIVHIELTSRCALRCPRCPRTLHPGTYRLTELPLEILRKVLGEGVFAPRAMFNFAGNYGDPIYHTRLHEVIDEVKKSGHIVDIETNGSGRSSDWWQKTISRMTKEDALTFSIDGLSDTFDLYRVGAQWESIMEAVSICRDKVHMMWKFIVFSHNQHQVQQAEELAKKLGFQRFKIVRSNRFGPGWYKGTEAQDPLQPSDKWLPAKKQATQETVGPKRIYARCTQESMHYISSEGFYFPSCWLGVFHDIKGSFLDERLQELSLHQSTLSEILDSKIISDLKNSWQDWSLAPRPCQYSCSHQGVGRTQNLFKFVDLVDQKS